MLPWDFADREGLLFMETSALHGDNVGPAFMRVITEVCTSLARHKVEAGEAGGAGGGPGRGTRVVVQDTAPEPPKRAACCN
jgi:hypothetical protein